MKSKFKPAVLFMNFNRPACTLLSLKQIRSFKPTRLYIACDGPRERNLQDELAVSAVRRVLSNIDWPCTVHRLYSDKNLGCKESVLRALKWFFESEEMGIVLEDDCIASPSFFHFTSELLVKYKDDSRVATISGNSLGYRAKRPGKSSYRFTQFMNMWGWATWRRTYLRIDNEMSRWHESKDTYKLLKRAFEFYGTTPDPKWLRYWHFQLSKTAAGEIDTWDYQWIFNILVQKMVCISPTQNLVENVGWGPGATHTHEARPELRKNKRGKLNFPLIHPPVKSIHVDRQYERYIQEAWCDLERFYGLYLTDPSVALDTSA